MRFHLREFIVLGLAGAIALKLFAFGLSYPLESRVRGDAYAYLKIAGNFDSYSAILSYAGDRTVGLPAFEFLVLEIVGIFTATYSFVSWVDAISVSLLVTHFVASWLFSAWARQTNLITTRNASLSLFFFLATYPALIGHTTSPLSDTFALDIFLCALALMQKALSAKRIYSVFLFSGAAALFFGFSILVRPGSILSLALAIVVGGLISLYTERRKIIAICAALLGILLILAPFCFNCTQKYGSICLQSPQAVSFVASAQAGLRGARTLWQKGTFVPGQIPVLPDSTMEANYYQRCHLTSIVGITDSSLTGCLVSRPLAIPAYVVKKWIGLFDHFRFTPYLEEATPLWLRWLSRAYDSLSWIGLALFFFALFQATKRQGRLNIKEFLTGHITPTILVVYSMTMLAQHTVLHIEDRYGFPVLPLCALMLVIYGEKAVQKVRSSGWRGVSRLALFCSIFGTMFVMQIVIWDNTAFY